MVNPLRHTLSFFLSLASFSISSTWTIVQGTIVYWTKTCIRTWGWLSCWASVYSVGCSAPLETVVVGCGCQCTQSTFSYLFDKHTTTNQIISENVLNLFFFSFVIMGLCLPSFLSSFPTHLLWCKFSAPVGGILILFRHCFSSVWQDLYTPAPLLLHPPEKNKRKLDH